MGFTSEGYPVGRHFTIQVVYFGREWLAQFGREQVAYYRSRDDTMDVRLWALAHKRVRFLFQPTYAPWLNLIEPWWKTLRSLTLAGHRFEDIDDLRSSIVQGTSYWNDHRHPYI